MALETALWQRVKAGAKALRSAGHGAHFNRIENSVGDGNPDVSACLDGTMFDVELKSEDRPKRAATPIRFRVRESQSIWHRERTAAGCKHNWVLCQVGEAFTARLYLIPGRDYDLLIAPEADLDLLSVVNCAATVPDILMRARAGY